MVVINNSITMMESRILLLIFLAIYFINVNGEINALENEELNKVNYHKINEVATANGSYCHKCKCNETTAYCNGRNITTLPLDLPHDITVLDLSSNHITALPDRLLGSHYKNLKTLDISDNLELPTLSKYAFQGLDKLENLYLRWGSGIVVDPLIFQPLKEIRIIMVKGLGRLWETGSPVARNAWLKAFKGLQNSTIEKIIYDHLSVTSFILRKRYFVYFKNCQLKHLHLPHNKITGIETGFLDYLPKLELLDLSRNMIVALVPHSALSLAFKLYTMVYLRKFIVDSSEARIIQTLNNPRTVDCGNTDWPLPPLEEINICGTSLDHRPASIPCTFKFQENNRLKIFNAANTQAATYIGGPVKGLVNLQKFIYSNNDCKIVPEFFTCAKGYFESLQVLQLAHNKIMLSHSSSNFTLFENCTNLTYLDISYNNLEDIPYDMLKETYFLEMLNLSGNKLNDFSVDLENVVSLKVLNLSHNNLQGIGESTRNNIISAYEKSRGELRVDLTGNPFMCNCDVFPFINWMKDHITLMHQGSDLTCQYINMSEIKFSQLDVSYMRLECWKSVLLASGMSIGIVLLIVGVVIYGYKRRYKIVYVALHIRALLRRNKLIDIEYDFDGFISSLDKTWAIDNIYTQLAAKYGYNICVDDRNFRPGSYISDIIIESISKSNKIILVISQNFLRSGWCKFEMNLARGELATRGRVCMIWILKEPKELLPPELITPTLRSLLDTRVYLEWSEEEDRKLLFWRQMRDALGDPRFRGEEDTPYLYQNNEGDDEMLLTLLN